MEARGRGAVLSDWNRERVLFDFHAASLLIREHSSNYLSLLFRSPQFAATPRNVPPFRRVSSRISVAKRAVVLA